jgi:thiol-disulfide isomerase/thioredoxin
MKPTRAPLIVAMALLSAACSSPPTGESAAPQDPTTSPTSGQTAQPSSTAVPTDEPAARDALLALELVDVSTGDTFTLAALAEEKPVLLETMAIWCTTCRAQQQEVVRAHGLADFHSVGIDVDPNERAPDLAAYAEQEGFDWRFVLADRALVGLLTERFGFEVTNPPSTPTFVIRDGSIRALEFGRVRSAEELVDELAEG